MHSNRMIVSRTLEVSANGYLLKDTSSEEFVKAFRRVRDGQPYLNHELASQIAFMEARGDRNPLIGVRTLPELTRIAIQNLPSNASKSGPLRPAGGRPRSVAAMRGERVCAIHQARYLGFGEGAYRP